MSTNKNKARGLGRGTGALFGTDTPVNAQDLVESTKGSSSIDEVSIDLLDPNPDQPRSEFSSEEMQELAESIKQVGIITPITVRQVGSRYQIISGERRYRASKLAGRTSIPAYIKDCSDNEVSEMALVENIQRADLNAIEIALAYQNLMSRCGYTQEQVSERVGKSRSAVANYLRILRLPAEVQVALKNRTIEMGHARALLSLEDEESIVRAFQSVASGKLSVRKTEELVKEMQDKANTTAEKAPKAKANTELPDEYQILKQQLQNTFNPKAELTRNSKGAGKIVIPFASDEELERLIELFDRMN